MTTTPIISTIQTRRPVEIILENLTVPSQDLGVPSEPEGCTPYSVIPDSPPIPVLALATSALTLLIEGPTLPAEPSEPSQPLIVSHSVDTPVTVHVPATPTYPPETTVALTPPPPLSPPAILAAHIPVAPFPAGMDHTFTPIPQTHVVEPDPALALLDNEEDKENSDPSIPFFVNDPALPTFFPLLVGETGTVKQTARYIYYRHNYQEVVGTMGKGHPCYASQVFLNEVYTGQLAQHITDNQLNMFHPHDPCTIILNEVLVELRNPRLHADISRLRECLTRRDAICTRQSDIQRLETVNVLESACVRFHLDMDFSSVRKHLQYARAIPLIVDKYAELHAKPVRPRGSPEPTPLAPCDAGPSEMPRLHGEGGGRKRKCFQYPDSHPRWCGKCLWYDATHEEIKCPMYEMCWDCGERGRFMFLRRHTCPRTPSPVPANIPAKEDYAYTSD
ncbi:hypothetical protein EDB86DRAFT_3095089 [Lactarius hatsudake]|nr:hypothetical protein EDB86DRAFT_3095089 [Lactarius hatsudake]